MPAGVYLHIPFCKSRCSYCDFATDVFRSSDTVARYVETICAELGTFASSSGPSTIPASQSLGNPSFDKEGSRGGDSPPVLGGVAVASADGVVARKQKHLIDTIYFGGGTPSLLSPSQVEKVLTAVSDSFTIAANSEITMEMNPATVTPETLSAYRAAGVNRASFGVQTFNENDLKLLARGHDATDARHTFTMLREAGYDNVSFDLIAGLPGQTIDDWKRNLAEAMRMEPEHLSLYLLEIHEGTPLAEQVRSGRRPVPDEDLGAEMYETMVDTLAGDGYEQYEISNFARPGYESRHNLKYWRLDPVYGFGVSAHSFDGSHRYANERDTSKYVDMIEQKGTAQVSRQAIDAASEFVFLGLRLTRGIDLSEYRRRFGADLNDRYASDLSRLITDSLIETDGSRLWLTRKGMLFSNEVFATFV